MHFVKLKNVPGQITLRDSLNSQWACSDYYLLIVVYWRMGEQSMYYVLLWSDKVQIEPCNAKINVY